MKRIHIKDLQHKCSNNAWLDTGATDHMVKSPSCFSAMACTKPMVVWLPNGTSNSVMQKGTVNITKTFVLQDVLCVLSFSITLLFISKLTENLNCYFLLQVLFIHDLCYWRPIGVGEENNGLLCFCKTQAFSLQIKLVYLLRVEL